MKTWKRGRSRDRRAKRVRRQLVNAFVRFVRLARAKQDDASPYGAVLFECRFNRLEKFADEVFAVRVDKLQPVYVSVVDPRLFGIKLPLQILYSVGAPIRGLRANRFMKDEFDFVIVDPEVKVRIRLTEDYDQRSPAMSILDDVRFKVKDVTPPPITVQGFDKYADE